MTIPTHAILSVSMSTSFACFCLGLFTTPNAVAQDRCCAHCGCHERVTKICRFVREDKKITATCWGVQEESFCVNGPSCEGCKHCETICKKDRSDKADVQVCSKPKTLTWTNWIPQANASIFTKKKLMKKTVTKSVPSFRWVVEDLCDRCRAEIKAKSDKPEVGAVQPRNNGPFAG